MTPSTDPAVDDPAVDLTGDEVPGVEVTDLRVRCGDATLVAGVSFRVAPGRVLALVGESGSGKTSTGLALLGEVPPGAVRTGSVTVGGEPVEPGRPPRPGVVGYVPQHPSSVLNPVRRIGAVLREIARRHSGAAAASGRGAPRPSGRSARRRAVEHAVHEALRRAQVTDPGEVLGRYPHQLSGGQQQRVVLAQALLCAPAVVVADEPTTGQDALTCERVVTELAAVAARGVAVLLLTHDLAMVRRLADDVVVLRDGAVVETGAVTDVLIDPRDDYTRALVAAQLGVEPPAARAEPAAVEPAVVQTCDVVATHRSRGSTVTVLHGVSISVARGRRLALVGRSGSGKTTLARCIAGLHPPAGGHILLHGTDLPGRTVARSRQQIAAVQYVFQDARASFDEHRTVLAQVARTPALLRGVADPVRRARDLLARVGLPDSTIGRRPEDLSGGELRRAALARALLAEPDLLVCDEVTAGLDTITQTAVLDLLTDLHAETGCALLLITHDLGVVAGVAEDVAVLDAGRVVEHGAVADVLSAPRHDLTRRLLQAAGRHTRPAS